MDKRTRTALIKRECLLMKDLMRQNVEDMVYNACNNVKPIIVDNLCSSLQKIVDDFNKHNETEHTIVEYIENCLETDELIEQHIVAHEEVLKNTANIVFDEYTRLFDSEENTEVELSVDMLVERLNGIATISQIKREFLKITEQLDEYGAELILELSNKLLEDLNIKINEITGGFAYEFTQVCKFLDRVFEDEMPETNNTRKPQKITSTRKMQQVITDSGYSFKRQNGTSHRVYENENGNVVVLPIHSTDLGVGLAYSIQKALK